MSPIVLHESAIVAKGGTRPRAVVGRRCTLLGIVLLAAACGTPESLGVLRRWTGMGLGEPSIEEARQTYLRACAPCHGLDARGDGPVTPSLVVHPPDLTGLAERHGGTFPRAYVIAVAAGAQPIAAHGTREMPVWSEHFGPPSGATAAAALYARRRLEMLASYIESLQR